MGKLKLHNEDPLQGEFRPTDLNLLFAFQVNCPGCFSYGFPMVELLSEKYSNSIFFLGLSTAFEDYEFNNVENTKSLIQEGKLVGETLKMFGGKMPYSIKIPIAMDKAASSTFDFEGMAEDMCHSNPDYSSWSDLDKKQMQARIKNHLLSQEHISLTFTLNQFQGTPTFVLFDKDYEILVSWFGHLPREQIESTVDKYVSKQA